MPKVSNSKDHMLQKTCSEAFETWTALFEERLVAEGHPPAKSLSAP